MKEFTFSAESINISESVTTSWSPLSGADIADAATDDQLVRITAQSSATGAANAELALALVHPSLGVIAYHVGTVVPTARRTARSGDAGGYTCSVAFEEGGKSLMDLLGAVAGLPGGGSAQWYIGVPEMGDLATLKVQAHYTKRT